MILLWLVLTLNLEDEDHGTAMGRTFYKGYG